MIRIVAGEWRGRRIATPPGRSTRPTSEKVRGAIFNALHARIDLEGAWVWDLYAGSGAMGLEALSRGAAHVDFVESDARAADLIRGTLRTLGAAAARWSVSTARVEPWLTRAAAPGGPLVVLIDPPYADGAGDTLLARLAGLESVPPGAMVVLESALRAAPGAPPGLELLQAKRYGDTGVQFLVKGGPSAGNARPEGSRGESIDEAQDRDERDA
jgi:16S rRNA (guanine966-N2)-methyltransferase